MLDFGLDFSQDLSSSHTVLDAWHCSRVAAIFKKGDLGDCANYRPISIINAAYKLFANILLQRLKQSGAEDRIWHTQFGFRINHGTADGVFLGLTNHRTYSARQKLFIVNGSFGLAQSL